MLTIETDPNSQWASKGLQVELNLLCYVWETMNIQKPNYLLLVFKLAINSLGNTYCLTLVSPDDGLSSACTQY